MVDTKAYVAYYYTTSKQQENGAPNVEAQKVKVREYIHSRGKLLGEFIDHENYNLTRRGALESAVIKARRLNATLIITYIKHIPLSDDLFIWLLKSNVNFEIISNSATDSCDTRPTGITIEHNSTITSARIKEALWEKLPGGRLEKHTKETVRLMAKDLHNKGWSLRNIAEEFNRRQIPTMRGRQWHASSVRNILVQRV